jgi:hypothetical protein
MTGFDDHNQRADKPPPHIGTFVLRLRTGTTGPPAGTITPADRQQGVAFHGWLDLMALINALRGPADDTTR